jgi:cytochrome c biogenesis protein CcmG/thiol:disulfide interchange protein DsbE
VASLFCCWWAEAWGPLLRLGPGMRDFQHSPIAPASPTSDRPLRRLVIFVAFMSPAIALMALLTWGLVRSDGNPGGLLEYNDVGDIVVEVKPAPAFDGTVLLGSERINNAAVDGKVVMVDFFSSWCIACKVEAVALAQVYREYASERVEFVGIAIWDERGDTLRHIARYGVTYPNIMDEHGATAVSYGVRGVPEKFFLDRNGKIVRRVNGPVEPERLRSIIDELLAAGRVPGA